jgi:hypothetical protein
LPRVAEPGDVFAALRIRVRTVLDERIRPGLFGSDGDAVCAHLRVAAGLGLLVAAATALTRVGTVVASPVVWEAFLVASAGLLLALTVANAYWRGGLVVGYALVFVPTAAGLFVAYVGRGPFGSLARTLGFGILLVAAVSLVVGTPGFVLGRAARWLRTWWRNRQEGST